MALLGQKPRVPPPPVNKGLKLIHVMWKGRLVADAQYVITDSDGSEVANGFSNLKGQILFQAPRGEYHVVASKRTPGARGDYGEMAGIPSFLLKGEMDFHIEQHVCIENTLHLHVSSEFDRELPDDIDVVEEGGFFDPGWLPLPDPTDNEPVQDDDRRRPQHEDYLQCMQDKLSRIADAVEALPGQRRPRERQQRYIQYDRRLNDEMDIETPEHNYIDVSFDYPAPSSGRDVRVAVRWSFDFYDHIKQADDTEQFIDYNLHWRGAMGKLDTFRRQGRINSVQYASGRKLIMEFELLEGPVQAVPTRQGGLLRVVIPTGRRK